MAPQQPDNTTPKKKKTRRMTICRKVFERADHKRVIFPDVRLCGKWLQEAGFRSGHVIDITCEDGRLTITLSEEQRFHGV